MNSKANREKIENDAKIIRNWLESIPYGQYNDVVSKLVERCMINKTTFRNWRYGNCRIPLSGKRDINSLSKEISGIEIFNLAVAGNGSEGVSGGAAGAAN